jgi:hypothetical protein
MQWVDARKLAGMTPWVCSYDGPDGQRYGITLYGTDAQQVLNDNCGELPGFQVDGELVQEGFPEEGDEGYGG